MSDTRHVVNFSGGVGSWAAARRVIARYGRSNVVLLFADTLGEDADLYRFLIEAAANLTGRAGLGEVSSLAALGANTPPVWERDARKVHLSSLRAQAMRVIPQLLWLADGRDIWDVFTQHRFLGNSLLTKCTSELKAKVCDDWLSANCDPRTTRSYVGIDWTEDHRYYGDTFANLVEKRKRKRRGLRRVRLEFGWRYRAPMLSAPYLTKDMMLDELRAAGIQPPRLYAMGFAHNNCGGICVKAGIGHYALLYRQQPEVFAHAERQENELRALLGNVSMLRDRVGGTSMRLPLTMLRHRIEAGDSVDLFDIGGCGCFTDTEAT
jgi:hypothetical protein